MSTASLPLTVDFGGYSDAGIKTENEDSFAAKQPSDKNDLTYKGIVACVADGASCSDNAKLASETSVFQFIEDYYSTPDSWKVKQAAGRVLTSLNTWLFHHGQQAGAYHNSAVTTFSSIIFKSTTAHIVHAGDSRIYRYRDHQLHQLTRDHTHNSYGSDGVLTRALGMDCRLDVDYLQKKLQLGDIYLITSDGFHNWLTEKVIKQKLLSDQINLEKTAREMVLEAIDSGSNDNVTCLLIKIDALPKQDIEENHRQLTQLTLPPAMDIGNTIDRFRIIDVLHSGTRSHVYLAEDIQSHKKFVLKTPSENFAEDPQYLEGFIREQWVGKRLNSKQIMRIYDRPDQSPFLYHVCQHIEGITLRQWMYDNPLPSFDQVRQIIKSIIKALHVMQRLSMVHRDLKPENIIISPNNNNAVIIDFGTVLVGGLEESSNTHTEEVPVGSVNYIAPEYLQGCKGSQLSDLFSLSVIAYEMLTGKLPYKTPASLERNPRQRYTWSYRNAISQRQDTPQWLDLALEKGCSISPTQRQEVLSEFLADITSPNLSLVSDRDQQPLMVRNPLAFWQGISWLLLAITLVEAFLLTQKH